MPEDHDALIDSLANTASKRPSSELGTEDFGDVEARVSDVEDSFGTLQNTTSTPSEVRYLGRNGVNNLCFLKNIW